MNTINTVDLRPGQIFTASVFSEGENLLVPAMVPIRQKDIELLFNSGIDVVTTEGILISSEGDESDPFSQGNGANPFASFSQGNGANPFASFSQGDGANPFASFSMENDADPFSAFSMGENKGKGAKKFSINDVSQNSVSYRAYKNLIERLNYVFVGIKSGVDIDIRAINNIGARLLYDLREHQNSYINFILGGEVTEHELAKSSVNTAILSVLIALELRLPENKINNIVAGALLHDIGMLRLSKGITEKKGGLSSAELDLIKSHPVYTSNIVSKEMYASHDVNLIALQHHERWDGKGYPDHLAGTAIDLGARIVSVADAFEAMVSKKPYRNSMVGYQAVKNILADNARRFDPDVIIAFTRIMGIYPIGSILQLNDKSVARVVSVHSDAPMRPVVQMLVDNAGNTLAPGEGAIIDLLYEKTLYIKNAIDPENFSVKNE
jgi:HD-GYP domain-containing protein (c-di-GMP phosphodiesterase class II)